MKLDQEIEVLSKCHDLLKDLDDDVKVRALQWLSSKFHLGQTTLTLASELEVAEAAAVANGGSTAKPAKAAATTASEPTPSGIESFNSFKELYKFVNPSSDSEKALVSAVFLQLKKDFSELTSAQVQKELKKIDQRVSNITQAISALVKKKMMIQLGKEGQSQQSRKRYKVTHEGIKSVAEAIKKK